MKKNRRSAGLVKRAPKKRNVVREIPQRIEAPPAPVPRDFGEARKNISDLVREAAIGIVGGLIDLANQGQVAPAKYVFEMVGLYPATAETSSKPENSLAYTLLQRMGLPPEPGDLGEEMRSGGER